MDIFYTIIGLVAIYAMIHFTVIQHRYAYHSRTAYERVVTWVALVSIVLIIIGSV